MAEQFIVRLVQAARTETRPFDIPAHVPLLGSSWKESWRAGIDLPDAWGVLRRVASDVCLVEVEVSNASAFVGQKARPVVDGVTVTVEATTGWQIVDPAPRPWPTLWPIQRGTWRRYALVRTGASSSTIRRAREYALGRLTTEWMDGAWQKFGPADLPLPKISSLQADAMRTRDRDARIDLLTALQTGQPWHYEDWEDGPVLPPVRGGWRPWGPMDQGAPGGSGIQFARGYQQSEDFARLALLASQCCTERTWLAYDRATGKPRSASDYGSPSPDYKPGSGSTNDRLPEFQGVTNDDPLPLEFDPAHNIRQLGWWIAAYEMTGSPVCARMLLGQAEESRMVYSEIGPQPAYGYTPNNVRNWLDWLNTVINGAKPRIGKGYPGTIFGRQIGWPMWSVAEGLKIDPTNTGLRAWATAMVEACRLAANPGGICQRVNQQPLWNDPGFESAQAFEVPILWHGVYALALRLGLPVPPEIVKAGRALYDLAPLPGGGPWHFVYVTEAGFQMPTPYITGKGADPGAAPGDPAHTEAMLALCYHITKDPYWLERSILFGLYSDASRAAKRARLEATIALGWEAGILAALQEAP